MLESRIIIEKESSLTDLIAFWLLGLCNNFGFIVMLTAASDIIRELGNDDFTADKFVRDCNHMSAGGILLADVVPAMIIKIIVPFIPGYVHAKIACAIVLSICSFLIVALAEEEWTAIVGVIFTSIGFGLGESTLVGYTASGQYHKNVLSAWSSGTGGAAIIGASIYSILQQLGIETKVILLYMLAAPLIEVATFWGILRHPFVEMNLIKQETNRRPSEINEKFSTVNHKLRYLPQLCQYIAPLFLIYFSQYFINQGLVELIYFPDTHLSKADQYRWFQVTYQVSVFIARSSVNLCRFRHIWILAGLQFFNMIFFSLEAVYYFAPNAYLIFGLIFCEGLIGGGAYVNTFYKISEEVPIDKRQFAMSITTFSDSPGITLAGIVAMPVHNLICNLPIYGRS